MSNQIHPHRLLHNDEVSHQDNLNQPKTNTNPRKFSMFFLKCIIMSCIISLFLLFLGFAALVLLHFLFITTAFRRRRTIPATTIVDHINLPEIVYDSGLAELDSTDCAICLEGFREGETCRSLPPCGHLFHVSCVDSWLTKVPSCPVCRTRVRLGPQETSFIMSNDDWKIWWAVAN